MKYAWSKEKNLLTHEGRDHLDQLYRLVSSALHNITDKVNIRFVNSIMRVPILTILTMGYTGVSVLSATNRGSH